MLPDVPGDESTGTMVFGIVHRGLIFIVNAFPGLLLRNDVKALLTSTSNPSVACLSGESLL